MAKCFICGSRKGKRKCGQGSRLVCSQCCGETRSDEHCGGCAYFRPASAMRRYSNVPRFSTFDMDQDEDLQSYARVIEGTLCQWDLIHEGSLNDGAALNVIERLLDMYHFRDPDVSIAEEAISKGFDMVDQAIEEDLSEIDDETIIRVLGVIYFVAKRRSLGGREYLDFIHRFAGIRLGRGSYAVPYPGS